MATKQSLWNIAILRQAIVDAFRKLDPRVMVKNPVMLVVEVGSLLTTALLIEDTVRHTGSFAFDLQIGGDEGFLRVGIDTLGRAARQILVQRRDCRHIGGSPNGFFGGRQSRSRFFPQRHDDSSFSSALAG